MDSFFNTFPPYQRDIPGVFQLDIVRNNARFPSLATLILINSTGWTPVEYEQAKTFLSPPELSYLANLQFPKRLHSYLTGRYAAKLALLAQTGRRDPHEFWVDRSEFNAPIVRGPAQTNISISHTETWAAALAFDCRSHMGLDIETTDRVIPDPFTRTISGRELELCQNCIAIDNTNQNSYLWTVKESISKAINTGLTVPFHIFEISQILVQNPGIYARFKNFSQYGCHSTAFDTIWISVSTSIHRQITQ